MSYYGPKDLKSQLIEFAARKLVSKVIDAAARHAGQEITKRSAAYRFKRQSSTSTEGTTSMSMFDENTRTSGINTRGQAAAAAAENTNTRRGGKGYQNDEPVELWVNTVIVTKDGEEPVRLLTGRPLRAFSADRDILTSNEEFNRVNRISNAFVEMLHEDAKKLNFGESKYYSPQKFKEVGGEAVFKAGIYIQLHREITDYASEEAQREDLMKTEREQLRGLFGG
jgi:hypothetical protein